MPRHYEFVPSHFSYCQPVESRRGRSEACSWCKRSYPANRSYGLPTSAARPVMARLVMVVQAHIAERWRRCADPPASLSRAYQCALRTSTMASGKAADQPVGRSIRSTRSAPPSEVFIPPSNRRRCAFNKSKIDLIPHHSVCIRALLAATVFRKITSPIRNSDVPQQCEKVLGYMCNATSCRNCGLCRPRPAALNAQVIRT